MSENKRVDIDFLDSLQPMLWLAKLTGLMPCFKHKSPPHEIVEANYWMQHRSRATRILQFLMIIGRAYVLVTYSPDKDDNLNDAEGLWNEVSFVETVMECILYGTVVLNAGCRLRRIIKITNMLFHVDKELKQRYDFRPRNFKSFNVRFLIWLMFIYVYVVIAVFILNTTWSINVLLITNVWLSFVVCTYLLLLCVFMRILAVRFAAINDILRNYTANQSNKEFLGSAKRTSYIALNGNSYDDIKFIFRLHNNLLDILSEFNTYSKLVFFWISGHFFYAITSNLYSLFVLMASQDVAAYKFQYAFMNQCLPMSLMLLIALSCGETVREANAAPVIIAKIYGQSEEIQYFMDKFMTKMIKHRVRFSALGFFDIDPSLLFTMYTSVTTYLIILIQFKYMQFAEQMEGVDQ